MITHAKQLFNHMWPNGLRVEVTDKGFTIWDATVGRWVIDGSCAADRDRPQDQGKALVAQVQMEPKELAGQQEIFLFYPKRPERKRKRVKP